MRKTILCISLLLCIYAVSAQTKNNDFINGSIFSSIQEYDGMLKREIGEQVKLVGIGDFATLAKETQSFNSNLCIYLITNKNFRNILLVEDEWTVRPLNEYLVNNSDIDSLKLNRLINSSFSGIDLRNQVFKSFLTWVKNFNLSHPKNKVKLYGTAPRVAIPSSYFLSSYVSPIDRNTSAKLAKKWDEESFTEQQSLKDIEDWCNMTKWKNSPSEIKKVIVDCKEDIDHNKNIFTISSTQQKFPTKDVVEQSKYIANKIILRNTEKSILFTENRNVMKSNYISCLTLNPDTIPTIGKLLNDTLKSKYYVSVTDYGATVSLPVADLISKTIVTEQFQPGAQAKTLIEQKNSYLISTDSKILKGILPQTIPFIKGRNNTLIIDKEISPFNALFLFKKISELTPTQ